MAESGGPGWRDLTPRFFDRVAVDRALAARPVGRPLHRAERLAVTRVLVEMGESATVVADMTGSTISAARELIEEVCRPDNHTDT